ncbi:MAG: TetR/AcrR family transcriptional regulator [Treponemataceae bacterium]
MVRKKLTARKMQADRTQKKIYDISISLMEKKGFNGITIEEICQKAGVSIGTFYNYFKSKDDIFFDIYKRADEYFEKTVSPSLKDLNIKSAEKTVRFFKYYAHYNQKRGLENITQLYNTKNRFFTIKGRYMQNLLIEIISEGQALKQFTNSMTPDEITDYLFIASRGVVYDWCIHEAKYDLEQKMKEYMEKLVMIFSL